MKFFIVLAAVATAVSANPLHGGLVNTGSSAVQRSDDGHGNYDFGYNEDHATGGTFRKESGSHGVKTGSYGLRDADGRIRTVNYIADALGFRASVSTNEPGVDVKQDPAATNLNYGGHNAGHIPAPLVQVHAEPILAHGSGVALGGGYGAELGGGYAAGPVLSHGAELGHYAEPLGHAFPSSYSVTTQHASVGPVLTQHAGPIIADHGYAGGNYGYSGY